MLDYRLKVFDAVARRRSFTKAAGDLCISQPAVTRHIKELERQFGLRLFERKGSGVVLTEGGRMLQIHIGSVSAITRRLEYDLSQIRHNWQGTLRLGASTTLAQYVLPPVLAMFHQAYRDVSMHLLNANTEQIEHALLAKEIDLGVIEGDCRRREIRYLPFAEDEIVLVCSAKNPLANKPEIRLDELATIPLLFREPGSGTLDVVTRALKNAGIRVSDLSVEMHLGSSEAIKSYVTHSHCMAFVSRYAVMREVSAGLLKVIAIRKFSIHRHFFFITFQGHEGGLPDLFMQFTLQHYKSLLLESP